MSDSRERVRLALNKTGLHLTRDELDGVMQAFDEPKRKAAKAAEKPAEKPVAKPESYGTGKRKDPAKAAEKPIAKPASYGTGKHQKPHDNKQGS